VTVLARRSIVDYQLDNRHITDPAVRHTLRDSYAYAIIGRVVGNIVVSVVYVFLVRALVRGRRWAYRRVILVGFFGIVGLLLVQATPYPIWMRVEQLLQALVLGLLVYFVLRPEVRAHFAPNLPGRTTRRFRGGRDVRRSPQLSGRAADEGLGRDHRGRARESWLHDAQP
jgi:hypothetical protein